MDGKIFGGDDLITYTISLDGAAARFYEKAAVCAGIPVEQVLADALYRLAGSLSLEALAKSTPRPST